MRAHSLLLFSLLALYSCRELVKDEFPEFSPVPTVNSILAVDSVVKVQVSLAVKLDTNQIVLIDNAEVLLYVDGVYKETLILSDNGIYSSTLVVEKLKTYRCEVSIPDFKTVTCSDSIPETTIISDIIHINKAGKDEEGLTYPAIKFTLTNNPSEKKYYEVIIRMIQNRHIRVADLVAINDPVILNEGLPIALFSNESMKGNNYTMTLNYFTGSAGSTNGGSLQTELFPVILEVRSVSKNYYLFVKQKYLYEKGRYPEFMAASTIAYPLYSNIIGGYGIFAGYSSVLSDTINPNH